VSAITGADTPSTASRQERPGPALAIGASGGLDADTVVRHLADVVESSPHAILSKDLDGTIRTWNRGAERLYGYSPDEAVGRSVQMLVPGDRAEEWSRVMSQLARGEPVEQLETERVRKDGRRIAVALTLSPICDGSGKLVSASEIGHDITDRKRAEQALRASEERFRKIFENAATGIAITDWQGRFQHSNPAYAALLGYSQQELRQMDFASLVHPEDRETNLAELRRLQAGEVPSFEIENRYVHRDGRPLWVHKFVSVLPDETGKPAYHLALITDITERKRAAAALRESEEKLRLFIEHAPAALAMFDRQMRYLAVSRRWLADYHLGDGEITGRSHYEVFPEILDRWREAHRRGLEGEVVRADEDFFQRMDGNIQCLRWEVRPWKQADATIGGIVILAEDISARKRAEEALVQSEERFRLMADHAPVMIWMSGIDKLCTWFNKPWLAFVGRSMGQELGNGWSENTYPGDFDRCLQTYATAFDARQPFTMEYRLKRHDGEYRWILDTGTPVHGKSGEFTGYIGSCIDITERKWAEERLRQNEARLQAILNTAADAIITMDIQGIIRSVNPATERMFGYAAAEMVGHDVGLIMPSPYREEHDNYLRRYLQTGKKHIIGVGRELFARRKDGSVFPVHLVVSETEERNLFTGILRDMTEYKRLEREVVEVASQTQHRIGQDLHDSVAQELTALNLLAGTLAECLGTDTAIASKLVQRMQQGLGRSQQELRAVMRGLLPVAVESNGLMAALTELANRTQQEGQVTCTFDCPEPVALADNLTATHLYLIAQEAVHNAVKHGKPRNIRISLHEDHHLVLGVECDGIGMPKRLEANRGLGLRIMRNRAAIIGAHLTIEPAKPSGTMVTCQLLK
jgi:PAS domain S-box-containing protein